MITTVDAKSAISPRLSVSQIIAEGLTILAPELDAGATAIIMDTGTPPPAVSPVPTR